MINHIYHNQIKSPKKCVHRALFVIFASNMKIIRNRFIPFKGFEAMNFMGILFCRSTSTLTPELLLHEQIHTHQMREMLFIGFYLWYVLEWFVRLFKPGNAYLNISFEREAYAHMNEADYLQRRKPFSWWRYL